MDHKRVFSSVEDFLKAVGQELPPSAWVRVDQRRIDQFAESTGDHQWIHVDPVRAQEGPFGTTIAHGYLTLSLLPVLMKGAYEVRGHRMGVNYGLDKVRFPAPVPVDSALRVRLTVHAAEEVADGVVQATWAAVVEREGAERPVCVAQMITRYTF